MSLGHWEKLEIQIMLRIKELCIYSSRDESISKTSNLGLSCQFKVKVNIYSSAYVGREIGVQLL